MSRPVILTPDRRLRVVASIPDLAEERTAAKRAMQQSTRGLHVHAAVTSPAPERLRRRQIVASELRAWGHGYESPLRRCPEGLACPLVNADARLADAPGPACTIQIVRAERPNPS
jgi:hypothetical protein